MYFVRLYGGDDAKAISPFTIILLTKLQQAICDLTYENFHEKQPTHIQKWFYAVAFPEDKLPRNFVDPKYEPHKSFFSEPNGPSGSTSIEP